MTHNQRVKLQSFWWPQACRAQGWKSSDRALRLRVCSWCVSLANPSLPSLLRAINSSDFPSRILMSTSDLDSRGDIDAVKSCLLMLSDDLKTAAEVGHPEYGSARRKRDVIRSSVKCLGMFEEHPRRYLASVVRDMFNGGREGLTIRDLTDDPVIRTNGSEGPSELERLVMRMAQVVNQKRNENVLVARFARLQENEPLSIHRMKLAVGVFCDCASCCRKRAGVMIPPAVFSEEDWADFEPELEMAIDEFGGVAVGDGGDPF